jgi:hypothetical protein
MKYLVLSIMIAVASLAGCKKEKELPQSIIGKWEVRHVSGGQVQVSNKSPYSKPGNGYIIEFSESRFKQSQNGNVTSEGTYTLIKDSANIDGNSYHSALFFNNETLKRYAKVSGDKLMLSIGSIASDGTTATYQKIR